MKTKPPIQRLTLNLTLLQKVLEKKAELSGPRPVRFSFSGGPRRTYPGPTRIESIHIQYQAINR
jgi:hypothetical protein